MEENNNSGFGTTRNAFNNNIFLCVLRASAVDKKCSGFTLIELLVVLVLIGLAGSMVAPNLWSAYEKARERNAVEEIAASIQD